MKSLETLNEIFGKKKFDLEHETKMVQARILSPILSAINQKKMTQVELEEKTGLNQSFLSAIFNNKRRLNMEHIAKFQNALGIKLQSPEVLSIENHYEKFYNPKNDCEYVLDNPQENFEALLLEHTEAMFKEGAYVIGGHYPRTNKVKCVGSFCSDTEVWSTYDIESAEFPGMAIARANAQVGRRKNPGAKQHLRKDNLVTILKRRLVK
ncbi:helix-turn-helix transcriptional regulator [Gaetbulibacter jejuensis]|uniref:HTH cro/C1-type domain-containing protein n=1 Tax=Gaetbulibacter jejuensis TaxID=584607 RepID=A0ABN1JCN7_9FLAO